MKNFIISCVQSASKISLSLRCLGLVYFFSGCQTTTTRFVDSRSGEIALVSTDRKESLHASTLKSGAIETVMTSLKKSTDATVSTEQGKKFVQLAKLQLLRGDIDAADKSAKRCLEIDLKNKEAKLVLAQVYFRRGLYDLSEMILNSTEFNGTSASEMQNLKALIAFKNKNFSRTWTILEEAIRLDPSNIAARLNFGMLLLEHQLTQKAAIQFERILQIVPKQPDALLMMSMIQARRGNQTIALETLKELRGEYKNNPTLAFNFGSLLFHGGNYEDASDYLKSYLQLIAKKQTNIASITSERVRSQEATEMIEEIKDRLEQAETAKETPPQYIANTGINSPVNSNGVNSNGVNSNGVNTEFSNSTFDDQSKQESSQNSAKNKKSRSNQYESKSRITDESSTKVNQNMKKSVANRNSKETTREKSAKNPEISVNLKQNGDIEDLDQVLQN